MMQAIEIKTELMKMGITQAEIARRAAVSRTVVSDVIHGRKTSKRVEQVITEALGNSTWPFSRGEQE